MPEISVVLPCFNELPNLPELRRRLVSVLEATGRTFEILFVDDGSRDGSFEAMAALAKQHGAPLVGASDSRWLKKATFPAASATSARRLIERLLATARNYDSPWDCPVTGSLLAATATDSQGPLVAAS